MSFYITRNLTLKGVVVMTGLSVLNIENSLYSHTLYTYPVVEEQIKFIIILTMPSSELKRRDLEGVSNLPCLHLTWLDVAGA